jgi:hypothetical protein
MPWVAMEELATHLWRQTWYRWRNGAAARYKDGDIYAMIACSAVILFLSPPWLTGIYSDILRVLYYICWEAGRFKERACYRADYSVIIEGFTQCVTWQTILCSPRQFHLDSATHQKTQPIDLQLQLSSLVYTEKAEPFWFFFILIENPGQYPLFIQNRKEKKRRWWGTP